MNNIRNSIFYKKTIVLFVFSFFSFFPLLASSSTQFIEGKHYQLLPEAINQDPLVSINTEGKKIIVIEFFSYMCPACNMVSNPIHTWSQKLSNDISFQRIPVEFFQGWELFSRAYYTAETLGVLNQFDPLFFNAIHDKHLTLNTPESIKTFFLENGVNEADYNKTYDSFAVNRALERAKMLMRAYHIYSVPSLIVGNKYVTDIQKAEGIENFIAVTDYLISTLRH